MSVDGVQFPSRVTFPQGGGTGRQNPAAGNAGAAQRQIDAVVAQLAAADRSVREHEQAHLAAAGPYARGGPSFSYELGPDGKRYAVGGEVAIDASPDPSSPEATIRKAEIVRQAALAPAQPSPQDEQVAAAASAMEAAAQAELMQQRQAAAYGNPGDAPQSGRVLSVLG